ncbi:alpha/beta hydrolase [Planctobacterium marinum]|uniref:Esterase n=1 Tax=Planctobacterium marinum TaxID=1631968 RepID=A0AA48HXU2_9ALTE|nr:hypothetical protein MACH26_33790 [Planctobacterium marinum]
MRKALIKFTLLLLVWTHCAVFAAGVINIEEIDIDSAVLGEERRILVYLPAEYENKKQHFPVLYITDGDIQGMHTKGTLDFMSKLDQSPDMIVVGIVSPRHIRNQDLTLVAESPEQKGTFEGADRFLMFIEEEVIPVVKTNYRTLDYQALSGTSHGGQFAINAMIKRPCLFDGIIAISPSLYWNEKQLLKLSEKALKERQLKGRLFLSIADEEPIMTEPFEQLVNLFAHHSNEQLMVKVKKFEEENHDSTTLPGQYHGLKYLFNEWPLPKTPMTLNDLQAHYATRSALLGVDLVIPEDRANGYGQWLIYLNREEDALKLLEWNRSTYPQSLDTHVALIKAYLHFNHAEQAKSSLGKALKTVKEIDEAQRQLLQGLVL